ncbi:MAG: hypothetical protein KIT14_14650 [bacterium]|nr:hypothetical protein [bacterium]
MSPCGTRATRFEAGALGELLAVTGNDTAPVRGLEPLLLAVFLGALGFHLWAVLGRLGAPLLEAHAFRQTQTAITVYWLLRGGPWLDYETPVLGPPWAIPFELPLYQWTVAMVVRATGLALDPAGRIVSEAFFLATLLPCWLTLHELGVTRALRWPFLALLVVSPLYVFWSRTFMIESTALCLGWAFAAAALAHAKRPSAGRAGLAIAFGALAAGAKITTFLGFEALVAGVLLHRAWRHRWRGGRLVAGAAVLGLPLLVGAAWVWHTDQVRAENPLAAGFITSDAMHAWTFGTWEQRLSADTWRSFYTVKARDVLGVPLIVLAALVGVGLARRRIGLFVAAVLLFLLPLVLFVNLHLVHDYYTYANGCFLVAAVGVAVLALLEAGGWRRWGGVVLLLAAVLAGGGGYLRDRRPTQLRAVPDLGRSELARAVRASTHPSDVLVVYGEDWSSVLPYYLERRAVMDRGARDPAAPPELAGALDPLGPPMQAALRRVGMDRVAALLACKGTRQQDALLRRLLAALELEGARRVPTRRCDVYFRSRSEPG